MLYDILGRINFAFSVMAICFGMCIRVPKKPRWALRYFLSALPPLIISTVFSMNWVFSDGRLALYIIFHNWPIKVLVCITLVVQLLVSYHLRIWDALLLLTLSLYLQGIQFCCFMILDQGISTLVGLPLPHLALVLLYIAVMLLFVFFAAQSYKKQHKLIYSSSETHGIILCLLIFRAIDNLYNQYLFVVDPLANTGFPMVCMRLSNIVRTALVLWLFHSLLQRKSLLAEKQITESLSAQRTQQYDYLSELMRSINIKSHDLKKQLSYLRTHEVEKDALIGQLEETLSEYDSIIQTRNETLSLILTEKSLLFRKYNIPFSCVTGSNDFSFMSGLDIYTLFTNLLDNALEACKNVDSGHQNVLLVIKEQNNFLSIHQENYYCGDRIMQDGVPVTTKQDSFYHGFGTKSIAEIVDRYNGSIHYSCRGNVFCVNILFPL